MICLSINMSRAPGLGRALQTLRVGSLPPTAIRTATATRSSSSSPLVELREYALKPEFSTPYLYATGTAADLRKSLSPLRFFSMPDTGGELNKATHAYYYQGGHEERNAKRAAMATNAEWKAYLESCRPCMNSQSSLLFVEAPLVGQMDQVLGLADEPQSDNGNDTILEIRRYKLKLGYDTVPKFLNLFAQGLPSKLNADGTDPTTSLVTLLYCEVGRLNEVIEIWRHGDGSAAMEQSRVAARNAHEWREAIASIADLAIEFSSTIHKPAPFSPIR
jgi:hypothetical protein